jgi:pentatricopeptide repeat protein
MQPTPVTLVGVLNACASVLAIEEGRSAHEQIIESGWDMYAKFGSMEDANKMFNEMPSHDVVTWIVMICEVWTGAGGTGTIPANAARRSAASPCHFRGCAEFMCQFNRT